MYICVTCVRACVSTFVGNHVQMDGPPYDTTHACLQRLGLDEDICHKKSEISAWFHALERVRVHDTLRPDVSQRELLHTYRGT
jgi:hypothetical protein